MYFFSPGQFSAPGAYNVGRRRIGSLGTRDLCCWFTCNLNPQPRAGEDAQIFSLTTILNSFWLNVTYGCTLILVYFQHLATCGWKVWRFSTKIYSVKIRKFFVTVNEKKLQAKTTAVKKLMFLQLSTVDSPIRGTFKRTKEKGSTLQMFHLFKTGSL